MKTTKEKIKDYPVDIVVTWVDGNDPEWRKEKNKYVEEHGDNREIRYREWDLMRYWFRGVEKFLPWIRKVFFVTWGHKPEWLNINNEKLQIVTHGDFIPAQYLPTFNSHTIEWNLHRIKGLSEHFIYSNDDLFMLDRMNKEDFFKAGVPRHCAAQTLLQFKKGGIDHILGSDLELLNGNYNKHAVIKQRLSNWFNLRYGKYNLYNLYLFPFDLFTGFRIIHTNSPYLKTTFQEIWEKEYKTLNETCMNKMRNKTDVNTWLITYWQMASNKFIPIGYKNSVFLPIGRDREKVQDIITNQKYKMLCLNDDIEEVDFEKEKIFLQNCFKKILPEKSSFEI